MTPRLSVVLAVREPDVPVTVSVVVPRAAVLLAVSVSTLDPVVGFGENDAVTPAGKPVTARFTLPVNPYCGYTETYDVPVVPWPRDILLPAETVKPGANTPSVSVVVTVCEPDVPVTVSVDVPGVAELLAISVSTLIPVVGFGEKDAVTPLGRPVTARFTAPAKPSTA